MRVPSVARSAGLVLSAAVLTTACAMGGTTSLAPAVADRIESDAIRGSTAGNAYELVRRMKPQWLQGRGRESLRSARESVPVVYVGSTRQGTVEILHSFALGGIEELLYVDATTATTRYGSGHGGGVILVVLRQPEEEDCV